MTARLLLLFPVVLTMLVSCGDTAVIPTFSQCQGIYLMDQVSSGEGVSVTLELRDDYTAWMHSEFNADQMPIDENGTWIINSDGIITVKLTEIDGVSMYPVVTIDFIYRGNILDAVDWDEDIYGPDGFSFYRI